MNNKLLKTVLENSFSKDLQNARWEWTLVTINFTKETHYCPCGHWIHNLCYIENDKTGKTLIVGNCCLKEFTEYDCQKHFNNLNKFKKEIGQHERYSNIFLKDYDILVMLFNKSVISELEFRIYNTFIKKKITLSDKQKFRIEQANEKICKYFWG